MTKKKFQEDFLQFVWKFGLFNRSGLTTNDDRKVQVIDVGKHNMGSGPDFLQAKIKLGEQLWVGHVEIHYHYNEWYEHHHDKDAAYNNVVLHVVYCKDPELVVSENENYIPAVVLSGQIYKDTLSRFRKLKTKGSRFIPCAPLLNGALSEKINQCIPKLGFERLERKLGEIELELKTQNGSIEEAFMVYLFRYFGGPANKEAFTMLARILPMEKVLGGSLSQRQLEALLFGLAGMLNQQDEYAVKLENEYTYLKNLYRLQDQLRLSMWHFSGVRPPGFPTVRIAQLAALLSAHPRVFNLVESLSPEEYHTIFEVSCSEYWHEHYVIGQQSRNKPKKISRRQINSLKVNVFSPFLFLKGKYQGSDELIERSVDLLDSTSAESNSIVDQWKQHGLNAKTALETQALLELKLNYCDQRRCLQCSVGYNVLKKAN